MARPDGKTLPGTGRMNTGSRQEKGMTMSEAKVHGPASHTGPYRIVWIEEDGA